MSRLDAPSDAVRQQLNRLIAGFTHAMELTEFSVERAAQARDAATTPAIHDRAESLRAQAMGHYEDVAEIRQSLIEVREELDHV